MAGLPDWCIKTLEDHAKDRREYIYTEEELEAGETHDQYWNACQLEMVSQGKMHGYMRMYWAKKVMEWTKSAEEAHRILIRFNDRYELDGRDPNGYTGVAWCFGKHDKVYIDRPIIGKLRYFGVEGLRRKFSPFIFTYVEECYAASGKKLGKETEFGVIGKNRAKNLYKTKRPKPLPSSYSEWEESESTSYMFTPRV